MYPNVLIAWGELPGRATRLEAPIVVVEVLSTRSSRESTFAFDSPAAANTPVADGPG